MTADETYREDPDLAAMLEIERRLLSRGYGDLPLLLQSSGDFEFAGETVDAVIDEARRYLEHQHVVDLAGARVLAAIGEAAVKAQAFDALVRIGRVEHSRSPDAR